MRRFLLLLILSAVALPGWSQDAMMKSVKPAPDGSAMKADKGRTDPSVYDVSRLGPQVVPFTTEEAAWKLAASKLVVYFFVATWCPTCQAFYQDLSARVRTLPPDVALVFVNYDKSFDLKKKYGVTTQHTYVVVAPSGEAKKVWIGSATVAEFVQALSKI